jgi:hypothetical protein
MTKNAWVVFLLAFGACSMIGDSGARILGVVEVTSQATPSCDLKLFAEGGEVLVGSRRIAGKFEETFVIAPGQRHYYVTIDCDGVSDQFRSSELLLGSVQTYREGVDLGIIRLESE